MKKSLMQVVLVHNYYQQSGGEDAVLAAEGELLRRHDHEVVQYVEDNRRIERMTAASVAVNAVWSAYTRRRLADTLNHAKCDVAHFHNTFPLISPSAYYACRQAGVPVVQTLHNYRLLCPGAMLSRDGRACQDCVGKTPPWPALWYRCYRESRLQTSVAVAMLTLHRWLKTWQNKVDIYIALTEFSRQKFIEGGLPANRMVVKPNFVDPDPGRGDADGQYCLSVGRLSPEKGIRTLLSAWTRLDGVPLKLVGDGPLLAELEGVLQQNKSHCVELLGRQPHMDVLTLMKGARFLVFPSECYEGFPVTIAEAFACGLPVIASRLGAMAEIVEDNRTGLHFTAGDAEDLASKVEWAWTHPQQMREMGKEARREYEEKYTAEQNYHMLMDIYQKAIARNRGR